jgi:glycosyltransferase involved in cell wall biosynthesis
MKVLHILSELQFSGAELMLFSASERFSKSGLEITILSTGKKEGIYAEHFRNVGWKVIHLPFKKDLAFFKELYRFLKSSSFDVVHIHTEQAFVYKAIVAYMAGSPKIISTVHNNFLFNGYLKHRRQFHHLLALKVLGVKFISISESVKQTEKVHYFTNTTLINNWINIERFNSKSTTVIETDTQWHEIRLISVGKCLFEKQHQRILELVELLVQKGIDCHYTHIGCGDLEEQEKQWVKDHNLQSHVSFISHTNNVAKYLSGSNFYLMPSLFEGLGNACLEAMAAGLYCIVNDAPGLNTLIQNDKTGSVVDFSEIKNVAEKIVSIYNNAAIYSRITKQAQLYVSEYHDLSNVEQMIGMYK